MACVSQVGGPAATCRGNAGLGSPGPLYFDPNMSSEALLIAQTLPLLIAAQQRIDNVTLPPLAMGISQCISHMPPTRRRVVQQT